ncbi:hypothetical protein DSECCO2_217920 [anaerobic digester metagenome]
MKIYSVLITISLLVLLACGPTGGGRFKGSVKDEPYVTPVSVKYRVSPGWDGTELKKVVVNGDNSVFVLTDKGVFRDFPGEIISKDLMYSSLADKIPMDISIQEETGYLYYLYADRFLTNMHAGNICGQFPENQYIRLAVNKSGEVLLLGDRTSAVYRGNNKLSDIKLPEDRFIDLQVEAGKFYLLSPTSVYRLDNCQWSRIHRGEGITAMALAGDRIVIGTVDGYYETDEKGTVISEKNNRLPVPEIRKLLSANGRHWFATDFGAYYKDREGIRYFTEERWLDQNNVIDMTLDRSGNAYLLTPTGLNKIHFKEETLAGKATYLQDNLRKYHLRFGFSAEARLLDPEDPTSIRLEDNDNDGLWTSFYLGSQAFRYAVTKEKAAKQYVWESFEPYERLLVIHPITGFSGRTFERTGYIAGDTIPWRPAIDPDWWWKGTTSTDEFVGYIFVASVIDQFIAETPEEKQRVADYIDAIMTHIVSNDYYFIDYDGQPTLWGRWNPAYVNSFAETQFDRRLNSTLTIAGLQLAYRLTGKEIYKTEAYRMMEDHGYLENMKIPMKNIRFTSGFQHQGITMGQDWNHSDDEMAFLTYWVLYHYAFDDTLRDEYKKMINDHWEIEKPERNALWNLLTYGTSGEIDQKSVIWYLREFPADTRRYAVQNSHRKDVEFLPKDSIGNFREQSSRELLPKGERPMNRHNANEFQLNSDRGSNRILAGDEYLLPYWMARYLRVLE